MDTLIFMTFLAYFYLRVNPQMEISRIAVYSEGIKKRAFLFCSNFMSFSPIDFIFIGWIGYDGKFCWVLRNFEF